MNIKVDKDYEIVHERRMTYKIIGYSLLIVYNNSVSRDIRLTDVHELL